MASGVEELGGTSSVPGIVGTPLREWALSWRRVSVGTILCASLLLLAGMPAPAQTTDANDGPVVSVRDVPTRADHTRKPASRHRHRRPARPARTGLTQRDATAPHSEASTPGGGTRVAMAKPSAPRHIFGKHSETADSLNNQAYRLQRSGRHSAAEPLLRQALTLAPNHPYALYNLGWCLLEQHRPQEALPFLLRTSSMQPKRWEPQQRLAEVYDQLKQPGKAAEARARAARLRHKGNSVTVRERVDNDGWMGSTDRKEERFLRDLARFRSGNREEAVDLDR